MQRKKIPESYSVLDGITAGKILYSNFHGIYCKPVN